jgi:hypothetical protein
MISGDDFQSLRYKVEQLKREKAKAEGNLERIMQETGDRFGVSSLTDAKALQQKIRDKELNALRRYNKARTEFDTKWQERLSQLKI